MAIKKATAFVASDGSVHASVEEAQQREITLLVERYNEDERVHIKIPGIDVADFIITYTDAILDILTTGPRSRPAARKQRGTNNPRRAAKAATPEVARAGFKSARDAADGVNHNHLEHATVTTSEGGD